MKKGTDLFFASRKNKSVPFFTRAIIDKYTEDIAVDGSLIQKELGFVPQYDLKTGWEETIGESSRVPAPCSQSPY